MKATEAVKDWKSLSDFIFTKVSGTDTTPLTTSEAELIEKESANIFKDVSVDDIKPFVEKIMNINILELNLDVFEMIPSVWKVIYPTAICVSEGK